MKDTEKTKEQLVEELVELRRRVGELDAMRTEGEQNIASGMGFHAEYDSIWQTHAPSPIPTLVLSREGKIIDYNSAMVQLTGYTHEEVSDVSMWMQKIYPDEAYRNEVIEISKQSRNREIDVTRDEFIITRKNGEDRHIQFSVYEISYGGKPTDLQIVQGEDITKRKKTEEELSGYRVHLEELIDNVPLN